jgi:hypothetical protein
MADDQIAVSYGGQNFQANSPGLAKLVDYLGRFIRNDAELRLEQARGAPRAVLYAQGEVTGNDLLMVPAAVTESFSHLVVMTTADSGSGRYMIHGERPTPDRGFPVPAGSVTIDVDGSANIAAFALMAEAGQTVRYSLAVFR